jgi:hypothetical protein
MTELPAPPTPTGAGGSTTADAAPPDDAGRGNKLGHVLE